MNNWISVDKRLPEPETLVLACVSHGQGQVEIALCTRDYDPKASKYVWFEWATIHDEWNPVDGNVSHWQPLPKLPNEVVQP